MTPYESVSWRKACEAVTFEIDYYVVAVQWQDDWPSPPKNRPLTEKRLRCTKQKTGKGPSNSRGTSQGPRRLSQEVHSSSVTKWTYTHLRMVAFPFPRCTTWQVKYPGASSKHCYLVGSLDPWPSLESTCWFFFQVKLLTKRPRRRNTFQTFVSVTSWYERNGGLAAF